jgi:hypothetical protein
MELKMFIGDSLIDSIPVIFSKITQPGYLEQLREKLEEKHADRLASATEAAVFYIDHVPSSMNFDAHSGKE